MTLKGYAVAAGAGIVLFAAGSAVGYFAKPAKQQEEDKQTVQYVVDQEAVLRAVEFVKAEWKHDSSDKSTTRIVYRDGKPVEKIVYRDRETHASGGSESTSSSVSAATSHAVTQATAEHSKTTEARASWGVEARGGWGSAQLAPDHFGGEIQFRALGPVWVGIGAEKTDKVRPIASVRVEFP